MLAVAAMRIKICGVRTVEDARMSVDAGADTIGLNFVPGRARAIDIDTAARILAAIDPSVPVIGIVADADDEWLAELATLRPRLYALQLHGHETPARCATLLARGVSVYKAIAVGSEADVRTASSYPGDRILFDAASSSGPAGGRGHGFDWSWLRSAGSRSYWLAGGLTPDNVAQAIQNSDAAGVDVASGVERAVGVKDPAKVAAFVKKARDAFAERITRGRPLC